MQRQDIASLLLDIRDLLKEKLVPSVVPTVVPTDLAPLIEQLRVLRDELGRLPQVAPPTVKVELAPVIEQLVALRGEMRALQGLPPVKPKPVESRPVLMLDRYSGTSTSWQKVVEWEVGKMWGLEKGELLELSIATSDYTKTKWRIIVAGRTLVDTGQVQSTATFPFYFEPGKLAKGEKVTIYAKSTDGTSITADGSITGREIG